LALRRWSGRRAGTTLLLLLTGLLIQPQPAAADEDDPSAIEAALETRLAYIVTGDDAVDETSRDGLIGLTRLITLRTTASLGIPMAVVVERDPLVVFPLLYWPITGRQGPLSAATRKKVNSYMHHGGMILFDTRDQGGDGPESLQTLAAGLDIPALIPVPGDHVLTRSFYLLRDLPGRFTDAPVFVQQGSDGTNDGVSPVVIGGNDWAAAWAVDHRGEPEFPLVPGGEQQREMAYRFGVNLVMYALTGSYKADQVHLPSILERLQR
jgi:hypothetical protein